MGTRITIDAAGRVVLPKPVRQKMQLAAGDSLELESSEEMLILRPVRAEVPLRKKHGIWVFRTGEPLRASVVDETIRAGREERDAQNRGRKR